ncbi:MAG: stage II sporulation protein R [Clostridia bacterium]|nr:stage II sporulation protein R [Clostridia bacterium]
MKKVFRGIIMVTLIALGVWAGAFAKARVRAQAQHGVLRLHILAASDSLDDQRRKLLVRDALLCEYGADLEACENVAEAQLSLTLLAADMAKTAEQVLEADGLWQPVTVEQTYEAFPTRDYGGKRYPAGMYHAVRVRIGAAEGRNWWCVMYPPLCTAGYSFEDGEFSQVNGTEIIEDDETGAVVRWKTAELLKRIF